MSNRQLRLFILRWHRRVGVAIALLVVLLVITGVALNHTEDMALDSRYISAQWAERLYGIEPPATISYASGGHHISAIANQLYFNTEPVDHCDGGLYGAVALQGLLVALCGEQLVLLSPIGELVERMPLPAGIEGAATEIGTNSGLVVLRTDVADYRVDPDTLLIDKPDLGEGVVWPLPATPPQALLDALHEQAPGTITVERFLLDLHSGRLPGRLGVWIMDLAAILLLAIALGGCWIWLTKPGRWARHD